MRLTNLFGTYFNPSNETKQLPEDSCGSNALGIGGLSLFATAAIGHLFFKAHRQTSAMLAGAGALFLASYYTEKSGYAWLVAVAATGGMTYKTVDAIRNDRLWVTVHFNIGDIIRALRETHPQRKC